MPEMKKLLSSFIVATVLMVVLVVWGSGAYRAPDVDGAVGTASVATPPDRAEPNHLPDRDATSSGKIMIPAHFQFPGVDEVPVVSSLEELLERYTPEQQEQILDFYRGFGGVQQGASKYSVDNIFSFRTRKQLAWLVAAGFPTPDEVLLAGELSDVELRRLAERGNFKAMGFYLSDLPPVAEIPVVDLRAAIDMEIRFNRSGSPYAAYVAAKRALQDGQNDSALAAYKMAGFLGDSRALDYSHFLQAADPDINPGAAVSAYSNLMRHFLLGDYANIQFQLNRRGQFPRFEEDDSWP